MSMIPVNDIFGMFSRDVLNPFNELITSETSGIDYVETSDEHIYKIKIPNFNNEDVKIQTEDNKYVLITAEKKERVEDRRDNHYVMQSGSSSYYRRFFLPENANVNRIKSSMENGVVTVVVSKN
ncbi:hypothetical protein ACOSQ3_014549 [Xanthoceras sorbifolium]